MLTPTRAPLAFLSMEMVTKRIRIRGDRGVVSIEALFDTGASKSLIRRDVARRAKKLIQLKLV